jgi:hypothetical protein
MEKSIFFETTESFGREEEDFRQFLLESLGDRERLDHQGETQSLLSGDRATSR